MKKLHAFILVGTLWLALATACSENKAGNEAKATDTTAATEQKDTASCSMETTIKDPNNAKPMALMMRQMADDAQAMRDLILSGKPVTEAKFPFNRFYLVEPTDTNVLEPQFFENARLFQVAYKEMMAHPKDQKAHYNAYIAKCVSCHESYCSGPLRRIRKLPIEG